MRFEAYKLRVKGFGLVLRRKGCLKGKGDFASLSMLISHELPISPSTPTAASCSLLDFPDRACGAPGFRFRRFQEKVASWGLRGWGA